MVTSKHNSVVTTALLAACVASTFALAACDSASSAGGSAAAQASNKAARLAASAGEARPKEDFAKNAEGKDASEIKTLGDNASHAIGADKLNEKGVWKNYLDQKSVFTDMDAAAALLNDAAKDLADPALKSAVESQLGATQLAQARLTMAQAEDKLLDLTTRAANFQIAASYINQLGAAAAIEDARAKGDTPADLAKYNTTLDQRKADTDKAKDAVAKLEKDIADKQAAAAKIYADTDASFSQAENMKGNEAIDTAKKAADARKEGDKLTEEAQNLQPQLAQAKTDLNTAQIQQADAESQLATASSAAQQSTDRQKHATDQAAVLHDQAKKLIDGDSGLATRFKEFTDLAAKLKADVAKAQDYADKSAKAYADALGSAGKFSTRVTDMQLDATDPLNKVAKDNQLKNLLTLSQAAAKEEVARANLFAYTVASLGSTAANAMGQAYKAAGTPQDTGLAAADKDKAANQDAALREFDAAAGTAKQVADGARDGSPEKWLGYTLAAVALHGRYIINGQNKAEYQAAAQAAQAQNPFLHLDVLAGTTAPSAPAPGAPSTPAPAAPTPQ